MSDFHYIEFEKTGSILLNAEEKDELFGYIYRLKTENDKLRELVWRLLEVDRIGATSNEWCEIRELARELGVEV